MDIFKNTIATHGNSIKFLKKTQHIIDCSPPVFKELHVLS